MPINPEEASTISVGQLAPAAWAMADMLPHEVNAFLKKGSVQDLADLIKAYIGTASSLAFNPTTVPDGGTLPTTSTSEWMLVGKGTFNNVGGASNITTTEELNALTSIGDYWTLAVEIPIDVELAGIVQTIRSGFTTTAPSENAVYDALALKANTEDIPDISGKENTANKQNSLVADGSGVKFPTVDAVNDAVDILNASIDLKLNISDYNDHFRGKYTSLALLQAAIPVGNDGDYAIVDNGIGLTAKEYIWDADEGWIESSVAAASTTDALPEGSSNLYFTTARVLATVLSGISFATGGAIASTDSVLVAFGKIQKQINDISTVYQVILTDVNFGAFINGLTGKTTPVNADSISIVDSADSNKQKKVSLTNIKAFLKTYFDTFYQTILVSGTSIKTIGGVSLLGSGDISLNNQKTITGSVTLDNTYNNCIVKVKATATISVPGGLADNFNCVFDVWSGFTATFTAISGASIIETALILDSDKMATLYKDGSTNVHKLKGQTT